MFEDAPYIDKIPEKQLKKEDILYVHQADPNRKLEYAKENCVIIKKIRPDVKFISYDGKYPTLCCGTLIIEVAGKRYFLKDILRSGGTVRPLDYDYVAEIGDWYIEPEELPEEIRPYAQDIEQLVNMNIEPGCCGGCI